MLTELATTQHNGYMVKTILVWILIVFSDFQTNLRNPKTYTYKYVVTDKFPNSSWYYLLTI